MKDIARYPKIVAWSDADGCFIRTCPGLLLGGCQGDDEVALFEDLPVIVDEAIDLHKQDGKPLLAPTYVAQLLDVA